ncbi:uncharacterized protein EHS24_000970 [Apiotrichum porosum]|uniref:Uncharacterized protein n=1 Tax=Apiotrichum porosum TaxID=105984 RepID=A0A427YBH6_9TREE|nr:uncharacterized protein EHS24_000970 [Apiotrichum porosum]RSH88425.1 hypothetical protein EHS24_000970 [Apiotrichum porosum]
MPFQDENDASWLPLPHGHGVTTLNIAGAALPPNRRKRPGHRSPPAAHPAHDQQSQHDPRFPLGEGDKMGRITYLDPCVPMRQKKYKPFTAFNRRHLGGASRPPPRGLEPSSAHRHDWTPLPGARTCKPAQLETREPVAGDAVPPAAMLQKLRLDAGLLQAETRKTSQHTMASTKGKQKKNASKGG